MDPNSGVGDSWINYQVDKLAANRRDQSSGSNDPFSSIYAQLAGMSPEQMLQALQIAGNIPGLQGVVQQGTQRAAGALDTVANMPLYSGLFQNVRPLADAAAGKGVGFQADTTNPAGDRPTPQPATTSTANPSGIGFQADTTNPVADQPSSTTGATGSGGSVNTTNQPTPAASVPATTGTSGAPTGGFSGEFDNGTWADLMNNPTVLIDRYLRDQGINPQSNNPLVRARIQAAYRALGIFKLMNASQLEGQAANPTGTTGFNAPQQFLDFFKNYMDSYGSGKGAAIGSGPEMGQMLQHALNDAASNPNGFWAAQLGMLPSSNPNTGAAQAVKPADQTQALQYLLSDALGGNLDPTYLQALVNAIPARQQMWQDASYSPGMETPGVPTVNPGQDWMSWLLTSGAMPGIGAVGGQ